MIHFLRHIEIDKNRWDQCVSNARNASLYAMSWYLDAVSPQWCALAQDDYLGVMPLCVRKKWGVWYVVQPPYTQFGGVFSTNQDLIDADPFLEIIRKRYRLIEINVPANNQFSLGVSKSVKRTNQYLPLNTAYELLQKDFHRNHRRNILKSDESGFVVDEMEPASFLDFKLKNQCKAYAEDVGVLPTIIEAASLRGIIHCYGACNEKKEVKAANMIIRAFNRIYLLASENTEEGKEQSLMFGILNHIFKEFAGQDVVFDFEGSGIKGVNLFNAGFGAKEEYYHHIKINRLLFPLNLLKR